jgi:hypothetical protein
MTLLLLLATSPLPTLQASAATVEHLVTITPFLQTVTLPAADPDKTFPVFITNNSNKVQDYAFSVVDFGSLNNTGGIVFAGAQQSSFIQKHGLRSWLSIDPASISIEPGKTVDITARIVNDDSLAPGGHYAAVVASVVGDINVQENGVSISQKLTSLVFATKTGGEKYDLSLKKIAYTSPWSKLPKNVKLQFANNGNVHVVPRGTVELRNNTGHTVAKGIINEASSYVLPESERDIIVALKPAGKQLNLPGGYNIVTTYRYDGYDNYAMKSLGLRYIPWEALIIFLIIIMTLGLGYYKYSSSFIGRKIARKFKRK